MNTYTLVHVVVSLVGIFSGLVVLSGLLRGRDYAGWTSVFLVTTVATSLTGFGFPFEKVLPSHIFGVISLIVLSVAIYARYRRHCAGKWLTAYIVSGLFALYLNSFVGFVQAFLKIPLLHSLAPTQSEPPFLLAQAVLLVGFVALAFVAVRRMHDGTNTQRVGS